MPHPSPRRAVTLLVAALAAVAALTGTAGAATCPDGIGVGLLGEGSSSSASSSYVVAAVDAGDSFSRRFQVCNGTDEDVTVELYAGAASVGGGSFRVLEGRVSSELTSWTRVEPGSITIPARRAAVATARFAVPRSAQDGERYGALLVALPRRAEGGVDVVSRVGVRVYLAVGDTARRTDFTVESLQAARTEDGRPVLRAKVRNTGQRALDPRGALSLVEGPAGTRAGPFPVRVGTTVAPGEQADVVVPLDPALSGGPWRAVLTLRAGGVERRASAVVSWPESGTAVPVPARELEGRGGTVVAAAGLVLLVAAVLLGLLLAARRRAQAPRPARAPGAGPVLRRAAVQVPTPRTEAPAPPPAVPPLAPLPVLPAPRNAAVRRALAQRAAGAGSAPPVEAP